eukprot:m.105707 g.105707  ORF g.105707 m.105707 type:complete len:171 (-) comp16881_c0_seq3:2880-3392(-)
MNLAAVLCPWSLSWRSRLSWCTLLYLTSLRIPFRNLPYLDMIMLDYPAGDCDSIRGQWAAFEAMLAAKKTKSLAVSNFSPDQIKCLSAANTTGNVTDPAVNQMQYSVGSGSSTVVSDDTALGGIVTQVRSRTRYTDEVTRAADQAGVRCRLPCMKSTTLCVFSMLVADFA